MVSFLIQHSVMCVESPKCKFLFLANMMEVVSNYSKLQS